MGLLARCRTSILTELARAPEGLTLPELPRCRPLGRAHVRAVLAELEREGLVASAGPGRIPGRRRWLLSPAAAPSATPSGTPASTNVPPPPLPRLTAV